MVTLYGSEILKLCGYAALAYMCSCLLPIACCDSLSTACRAGFNSLLFWSVICRSFVASASMDEVAEVELFLNTVPLLASLSRDDKQRLVEGFYVHEYKGEMGEVSLMLRDFLMSNF